MESGVVSRRSRVGPEVLVTGSPHPHLLSSRSESTSDLQLCSPETRESFRSRRVECVFRHTESKGSTSYRYD